MGGLDVLELADVTPVRPSLQTWSQLSAVLTAQRMDGLPKARLWRLRLNAFPLQEASSCPHPSSGCSDHLSLDLFLLTESPVTLKSEMCFICTSLAPDAEPSAGSQVVKGKVASEDEGGSRDPVSQLGVPMLLIFLSLY